MEEAAGDLGDVGNGLFECFFVGFGGLAEAGDLADELEGGGLDFVGGYGRIEVEEGSDVSAHGLAHFREMGH